MKTFLYLLLICYTALLVVRIYLFSQSPDNPPSFYAFLISYVLFVAFCIYTLKRKKK